MFRRKSLPKPHHEEHLPTSAQIDKDLKMIYEQVDGEETDFSKLEGRTTKSGRRLLVWLLATLVILAGAAYGGYLVFERAVSGSGETLSMSLEGPSEVTSGEEVQFDVRYQNTGTVPLGSLEVKLNIPKGFVVESTEPAPTSGENVWVMGAITAGSDGLIRLKGVWVDPVPSTQTLQALATYRPANFNADFQKIATKSIGINASVLSLTSTGPTTGTAGSNADYTFTIKNNGKRTVEAAHVRLTIPAAFLVNESEPEPIDGGTTEWLIPTLAAGAETAVKVSGTFAADSSGLTSLAGSVGLIRESEYVQQASSEWQTDLVGGGLTLRLIVNGSTTDQTTDPGSTLRCSIDFINGGDKAIDGLTIVFNATSPGGPTTPITWSKADVSGGQTYLNENDEVVWKGTTLQGDGVVEVGERETIDFSLPLDIDISTGFDTMTFTVLASIDDSSTTDGFRSLSSTPLKISINSDTTFATDARYFQEGTPVGTGPLPPAVEQTTRYRLSWNVSNTLHALDGLTVSASIPPGVTYVGSVVSDMGIINFDPTSRLLTWTIDRLPTTITNVSTSFDLSVTPTSSDVGTFVKLMNTSNLTATDSVTSARIESMSEAQTTEIPNDSEAKNKGAVVE